MAEKTTAGRYYESVCNVTDGVERLGASSSSQLQESVAHDFQFSVDALRVGLMHNQFLLSNGMTGQSTNRSDPSSVAATPNYGVHSSSTESWSFASESTRRRLGHLSGLRVSLARREQTLSQGVVEKTLSLCIVSVDPSKEAEWLACTEGVLPDCPKWILPGVWSKAAEIPVEPLRAHLQEGEHCHVLLSGYGMGGSLAACTAMRLLEYIVRSPQKAALASPQKSVQAMCSRVQCVTFGEIPAAVSHKRSPTHEPLTDSVWSFFALRDPVPFETMAFVNEILQRRTPATSTDLRAHDAVFDTVRAQLDSFSVETADYMGMLQKRLEGLLKQIDADTKVEPRPRLVSQILSRTEGTPLSPIGQVIGFNEDTAHRKPWPQYAAEQLQALQLLTFERGCHAWDFYYDSLQLLVVDPEPGDATEHRQSVPSTLDLALEVQEAEMFWDQESGAVISILGKRLWQLLLLRLRAPFVEGGGKTVLEVTPRDFLCKIAQVDEIGYEQTGREHSVIAVGWEGEEAIDRWAMSASKDSVHSLHVEAESLFSPALRTQIAITFRGPLVLNAGLHSILHPTVAALFQNRSQKAQPSSTPTVSRAAESSNNHLAGVCWMLGSEGGDDGGGSRVRSGAAAQRRASAGVLAVGDLDWASALGFRRRQPLFPVLVRKSPHSASGASGHVPDTADSSPEREASPPPHRRGSDISPVAQTMSEGAPTRLEETEVSLMLRLQFELFRVDKSHGPVTHHEDPLGSPPSSTLLGSPLATDPSRSVLAGTDPAARSPAAESVGAERPTRNQLGLDGEGEHEPHSRNAKAYRRSPPYAKRQEAMGAADLSGERVWGLISGRGAAERESERAAERERARQSEAAAEGGRGMGSRRLEPEPTETREAATPWADLHRIEAHGHAKFAPALQDARGPGGALRDGGESAEVPGRVLGERTLALEARGAGGQAEGSRKAAGSEGRGAERGESGWSRMSSQMIYRAEEGLEEVLLQEDLVRTAEDCYEIVCVLAQEVSRCKDKEVEHQREQEQLLVLLESQSQGLQQLESEMLDKTVELEQLECEVLDKTSDVDLVMSLVDDMEDQVEAVRVVLDQVMMEFDDVMRLPGLKLTSRSPEGEKQEHGRRASVLRAAGRRLSGEVMDIADTVDGCFDAVSSLATAVEARQAREHDLLDSLLAPNAGGDREEMASGAVSRVTQTVESCYDILCMLAQAVAGFREREVEQQTELEQLLELLESQNVEREQLEAEVVDKSTDVDLVMSQVEDMEDQVECVWSLVEAAALAASRAKASQAPDPSKPGGMDDAVKRKLQRMEHEIAETAFERDIAEQQAERSRVQASKHQSALKARDTEIRRVLDETGAWIEEMEKGVASFVDVLQSISVVTEERLKKEQCWKDVVGGLGVLLAEECEESRRAVGELSSELVQSRELLGETEERLRVAMADLDATGLEAVRGSQVQEQLRLEIDVCKEEARIARDDVDFAREDVHRLEQQLADVQTQRDDSETKTEAIRQECQQLQHQVREHELEIERFKDEANENARVRGEQTEEISELKRSAESLRRECQQLQHQAREYELEIERLKDEANENIRMHGEQIQEISELNKSADEERTRALEEVSTTKKAHEEQLCKILQDLETQRDESETKEETLRRECQQLQHQVREYELQVDELKEEAKEISRVRAEQKAEILNLQNLLDSQRTKAETEVSMLEKSHQEQLCKIQDAHSELKKWAKDQIKETQDGIRKCVSSFGWIGQDVAKMKQDEEAVVKLRAEVEEAGRLRVESEKELVRAKEELNQVRRQTGLEMEQARRECGEQLMQMNQQHEGMARVVWGKLVAMDAVAEMSLLSLASSEDAAARLRAENTEVAQRHAAAREEARVLREEVDSVRQQLQEEQSARQKAAQVIAEFERDNAEANATVTRANEAVDDAVEQCTRTLRSAVEVATARNAETEEFIRVQEQHLQLIHTLRAEIGRLQTSLGHEREAAEAARERFEASAAQEQEKARKERETLETRAVEERGRLERELTEQGERLETRVREERARAEGERGAMQRESAKLQQHADELKASHARKLSEVGATAARTHQALKGWVQEQMLGTEEAARRCVGAVGAMGRDIAAVKGCEREMARLQKEVEHADAAREELRESFMAIQRYEAEVEALRREVEDGQREREELEHNVQSLRITLEARLIASSPSSQRFDSPLGIKPRMSDTFREERRSSSGAWEGRRDGVTRRLRDEFDGLQMSRTASNVTRPAGNAFRVETEVALRMQELDEEVRILRRAMEQQRQESEEESARVRKSFELKLLDSAGEVARVREALALQLHDAEEQTARVRKECAELRAELQGSVEQVRRVQAENQRFKNQEVPNLRRALAQQRTRAGKEADTARSAVREVESRIEGIRQEMKAAVEERLKALDADVKGGLDSAALCAAEAQAMRSAAMEWSRDREELVAEVESLREAAGRSEQEARAASEARVEEEARCLDALEHVISSVSGGVQALGEEVRQGRTRAETAGVVQGQLRGALERAREEERALHHRLEAASAQGDASRATLAELQAQVQAQREQLARAEAEAARAGAEAQEQGRLRLQLEEECGLLRRATGLHQQQSTDALEKLRSASEEREREVATLRDSLQQQRGTARLDMERIRGQYASQLAAAQSAHEELRRWAAEQLKAVDETARRCVGALGGVASDVESMKEWRSMAEQHRGATAVAASPRVCHAITEAESAREEAEEEIKRLREELESHASGSEMVALRRECEERVARVREACEAQLAAVQHQARMAVRQSREEVDRARRLVAAHEANVQSYQEETNRTVGGSLHVLLQEIELAQAAFHTCKAEVLQQLAEAAETAVSGEAVSAELAGLRQDMESKVAEREMRIAELESQVQECRSSLSSTEQALTAARNDASTLEAELAKMAEQLDQSVHKEEQRSVVLEQNLDSAIARTNRQQKASLGLLLSRARSTLSRYWLQTWAATAQDARESRRHHTQRWLQIIGVSSVHGARSLAEVYVGWRGVWRRTKEVKERGEQVAAMHEIRGGVQALSAWSTAVRASVGKRKAEAGRMLWEQRIRCMGLYLRVWKTEGCTWPKLIPQPPTASLPLPTTQLSARAAAARSSERPRPSPPSSPSPPPTRDSKPLQPRPQPNGSSTHSINSINRHSVPRPPPPRRRQLSPSTRDPRSLGAEACARSLTPPRRELRPHLPTPTALNQTDLQPGRGDSDLKLTPSLARSSPNAARLVALLGYGEAEEKGRGRPIQKVV